MHKYLLLFFVVFSFASCDDDHSREEIALENIDQLELKKQMAKAHAINSFTADITKLVVGTIVQYPILHTSDATTISSRSNVCPVVSPDPGNLVELPAGGLTMNFETNEDCPLGFGEFPGRGDIKVNMQGNICTIRGSVLEICPERNFEYFVPASELNDFVKEGFIITQPGCFKYTYRETNPDGDLCYDVEIPENFLIDDQSIFKNKFILCDIENGKLRITNTENDVDGKPETLLDNDLILTYDDVTVGKLLDCDADEVEFMPGELRFNYFCKCPVGGSLNFNFQGLPVVLNFKENFECQGLVDATVNDVPFPTADIINCN